MRPSEAVNTYRDFIRQTVAAHRASSPRIFGSVLTQEDTEDSDLDILVEPTPETSLLDLAKIECALRKKLGVKVDVLTPDFLSPSFRDEVLKTAVAI
ncbi:nucleotidyltransferase family protein [Thiothrix nivea]|uniref:DNA polymerase beta domain protein region n=1 Tax=Thiothrix nivea (strain ATCC 35100 / DSM 5205 / JP2) TaxID=870187 RepID=A0A656HF58_THINJ|nr:nucleotidyltransferase family protein [Thiothrix nivea]EIJ34993.1 DNA polymerase beta domain protein region [Thiothrix nivea DSM 5205]